MATAALGATLWLRATNGPGAGAGYAFAWTPVLDALAFYASAVVGALLAFRRPRNPVGWLLLAMATTYLLQDAAAGYARVAYAAASEPVGPLALLADWLSSWLWTTFLIALPWLLLLFPDGRPPSRRWGQLVWAIGIVGTALTVFNAVTMWLARSPTNRLVEQPDDGRYVAVLIVLLFALFGAAVAAAASLVVRYRRAVEVERQQLRWIAAAGAALALTLLVGALGDLTGVTALALLGEIGGLIALTALPASIAVAVLRYRLYDIDRIVSRTVSYGLLTGVLAGVYLAAVLTVSRLANPIDAGTSLSVAAATLITAAVFTPARRSIQVTVDRRFNRARYDAEQVVAALRSRLRAEAGLDDVIAATRDAVGRTVQPQRLSLTLLDRGPSPSSQ